MRSTIEIGDKKYIYNSDQETKDTVFETILAFCKEHKVDSGESACQNDKFSIVLPYIIATLL